MTLLTLEDSHLISLILMIASVTGLSMSPLIAATFLAFSTYHLSMAYRSVEERWYEDALDKNGFRYRLDTELLQALHPTYNEKLLLSIYNELLGETIINRNSLKM